MVLSITWKWIQSATMTSAPAVPQAGKVGRQGMDRAMRKVDMGGDSRSRPDNRCPMSRPEFTCEVRVQYVAENNRSRPTGPFAFAHRGDHPQQR